MGEISIYMRGNPHMHGRHPHIWEGHPQYGRHLASSFTEYFFISIVLISPKTFFYFHSYNIPSNMFTGPTI
jgi:hypothetical protein